MSAAVRRVAAITAVCGLMLAAPSLALAHPDPFEPDHAHTTQETGGTGNGPVVAIAVVVLMLGSAGALVGLRRSRAT